MDNKIKMYHLLKDFCDDNGKYRKLYYDLMKCKGNILNKLFMDDDKNHKHGYIYSCVYDFCKEFNLQDEKETLINLFENNYIYEVITPCCLIHNFEIFNKDIREV